MFNILLSIFLVVCFLFTWAGMGTIIRMLKANEEAHEKFRKAELDVFDKQISATKLVNEAIRNDIELTNNVKYDLDIIHGEVLAVKEQTKKAEKKTKVSKKKKVDDTDSSTVSTREDLEQL